MRRTAKLGLILAAPLALGVAACTDNTAPGNDRAAELEPPAPAAMVAPAGEALRGVATGLIMPQIMTDADVRAAPPAGACRFRMTRVGFPVLLYGKSAVVKLNDRLVPLPAAGPDRYAADGVTVTVRPLDAGEPTEDGEVFEAEFVLRLPGAANELGFHGFAECEGAVTANTGAALP